MLLNEAPIIVPIDGLVQDLRISMGLLPDT